MRFLIFLITILSIYSCSNEDDFNLELNCLEEGCNILNPISFSISPITEAISINYRQSIIVDGAGKTCFPDALDFYISEDNEDFTRVERVESLVGSLTIENLKDGQEYFIKMVNLHCELDSIISGVQSVIVQDITEPLLSDILLQDFEDFRLSPDGDQFIYRSGANDWYLSSLSAPQRGSRIIDQAFYAQWDPNSTDVVSFVQNTNVDITASTKGVTAKSLMNLNLDSKTETTLHDIDNIYDFNRGVHNPNQYWIQEFHYSLDGKAIYFLSNKDNGSKSHKELLIYNNIWKYDLASGSIVSVSDFLPVEFEIRDFVEDPKRPGNFYILGSKNGEVIDLGAGIFDVDRVDIHYFEPASQTISLVYQSDFGKTQLSIDPIGDNVLFSSSRSGSNEIYSFNLVEQKVKQITNSINYSSSYRWNYLNWISNTEFMTAVNQDGNKRIATFSIK